MSNSDVPDVVHFGRPLIRWVVFCVKTNAPVKKTHVSSCRYFL
jgi:hypothetical protein